MLSPDLFAAHQLGLLSGQWHCPLGPLLGQRHRRFGLFIGQRHGPLGFPRSKASTYPYTYLSTFLFSTFDVRHVVDPRCPAGP